MNVRCVAIRLRRRTGLGTEQQRARAHGTSAGLGIWRTGGLWRFAWPVQRGNGQKAGQTWRQGAGGQRPIYGIQPTCPATAGSLGPGARPLGHRKQLFHVKDDSFGEDRQVLHSHHRGTVISLLRNAAVTLLRGRCPLWSAKEPLTGRAQRLAANLPPPSSPLLDFGKALRFGA